MKNAVVWSEIAVSDLKRATAFYEKLLDGKLKPEAFGPFRIACFPYAADGVGGCLVHGEGYEPSAKGTVTYLAATPSKLLVVALEDALGLEDQPNVPGTIDEHPNWRRRYPVDLEDILAGDRMDAVARAAAAQGRAAASNARGKRHSAEG